MRSGILLDVECIGYKKLESITARKGAAAFEFCLDNPSAPITQGREYHEVCTGHQRQHSTVDLGNRDFWGVATVKN